MKPPMFGFYCWRVNYGRWPRWVVWIRVFGWGVKVKPSGQVLFSERNHIVPYCEIGPVAFTVHETRSGMNESMVSGLIDTAIGAAILCAFGGFFAAVGWVSSLPGTYPLWARIWAGVGMAELVIGVSYLIGSSIRG